MLTIRFLSFFAVERDAQGLRATHIALWQLYLLVLACFSFLLFSNAYAENKVETVSFSENAQNYAAKPVESLPSLLGLGSPTLSDSYTGDPTFAQALTQWENPTGAILEWQRIAHVGMENEAAKALLNIAALGLKIGRKDLARSAMEQFVTRFSTHSDVPLALYLFSQSVGPEKRLDVVRLATSMAPESSWTLETQYAYFWQQAWEQGHFAPNDSLDARLPQLQRRLDALDAHFVPVGVRDILAFLPGAIPILLGAYSQGILLLFGTFLVVWNSVYALRKKAVPLLALLLFVLAVFGWHSRVQAVEMMMVELENIRHSAMESWEGLQPAIWPEERPSHLKERAD